MKRTLEALVAVLALSAGSCAAVNSAPSRAYSSIADLKNPADVEALKNANYMIVSESKYKDSEGVEITLHSLGTAVVYANTEKETYLVTASHVVQNEESLFNPFIGKLERTSEQFYLLEDDEVQLFNETIRNLCEFEAAKSEFYVEDVSGKKKEPANGLIHASADISSILNVMKPKRIQILAQNEDKDLAIISIPSLHHPPRSYSIGDGNQLQLQDTVLVVGYPAGLFENVSRGYITSTNNSIRQSNNPEYAFIFDASVSPGNSGGGIVA